MTQNLDSLLRPRSVAMIGASGDVTRIGGRALRHLREAGFTGDIFPVNPSRSEVQGLKAWSTVADIPGRPDCAVLALPTGAVLPAIEDCARKGVGAAVIFSAGFAEMGEDGALLQNRILDVARSVGMRLLGPNCLGIYNLPARSFLSFSGIFDDVIGTDGRLGLVSQSGGYAGEVVKSAQEVGLNFGVWITTGNEVDIGLGEAMGYLAQSDDVDVVVGYIEGIRDPAAFFDALAVAHARRKPVIVLKVGRTEQGARAAASHTASLAGSDGVYDAVFARFGAYRARTTEEMLDVANAASRGRFPVGKRLANPDQFGRHRRSGGRFCRRRAPRCRGRLAGGAGRAYRHFAQWRAVQPDRPDRAGRQRSADVCARARCGDGLGRVRYGLL